PEVWDMGVRNPFKYSFDPLNKALVIADVGQDSWEEIDYEPFAAHGGRNYGWVVREGKHNNRNAPAGTTLAFGATDPIFEYDHSVGHSITGGEVYRGSMLNGYNGRYFFADFVNGRAWSLGLNVDPITGEATAGSLIEHTAAFGGSTFL